MKSFPIVTSSVELRIYLYTHCSPVYNFSYKLHSSYRMEDKLGAKKFWRIPQSEFQQTKSLVNYAIC